MDWEDFFGYLLKWVVGGIVVFLLGLTGTAIVKATASNGEISYCYIETNVNPELPIYNLYGFRPWRLDRKIASFKTTDEAIQFADKMSCSIKVKP